MMLVACWWVVVMIGLDVVCSSGFGFTLVGVVCLRVVMFACLG